MNFWFLGPILDIYWKFQVNRVKISKVMPIFLFSGFSRKNRAGWSLSLTQPHNVNFWFLGPILDIYWKFQVNRIKISKVMPIFLFSRFFFKKWGHRGDLESSLTQTQNVNFWSLDPIIDIYWKFQVNRVKTSKVVPIFLFSGFFFEKWVHGGVLRV